MSALTKENLRQLGLLVRLGRNPAATVYDSLGSDFFIAPPGGWLNLGLWEPGESDASRASAHLVETLARPLPRGGVIVDAGNGLGAQDPVIAGVTAPSVLIALNITESQLRHGRERLAEARAVPLAADATRIPLREGSADGIISVEAAFHFPSRPAFFTEARRVLRPGGILSMSDVSLERWPVRPGEVLAGITNLRMWGLKVRNMASADQIAKQLWAAGFQDVAVRRRTQQVLDPAIRYLRSRLAQANQAPWLHRRGARLMLDQWERLGRRGVIDYLLITASSRALAPLP